MRFAIVLSVAAVAAPVQAATFYNLEFLYHTSGGPILTNDINAVGDLAAGGGVVRDGQFQAVQNSQSNVPNGYSNILAINDLGQFVGYSDTPIERRQFVGSGTQANDISGLDGGRAFYTDISNTGAVVGYSCRGSDCFNGVAVVWKNGQVDALALNAGFKTSYAKAINNNDVVVGAAVIHGPNRKAAVWQNGQLVTLPDLGGVYGAEASAISDDGYIGGVAFQDGATQRPVVWRNGAIQELTNPFLKVEGQVVAVNEQGIAIGSGYMGNNGNRDFISYDGKSFELLQRRINPAFAGWTVSANAINKFGQMSGYACNAANECTAAILNPVELALAVPEPKSWAMLLIGFAGMGAGFRVRRRQISSLDFAVVQ